jgi:hypothetical protein
MVSERSDCGPAAKVDETDVVQEKRAASYIAEPKCRNNAIIPVHQATLPIVAAFKVECPFAELRRQSGLPV